MLLLGFSPEPQSAESATEHGTADHVRFSSSSTCVVLNVSGQLSASSSMPSRSASTRSEQASPRPSWFWDYAYLFSNYHLEHHYFPRVPFYNLPRLHRALRPFYDSVGLEARGYGDLLWHYLVLNRAPHTNWHGDGGPARATPRPAGS